MENKGEKTGENDGFEGLLEAIAPQQTHNLDKLYNWDFVSTMAGNMMFTIWNMACLWIELVVGVSTYYMVGNLVEMGMSWWEGILTVLIENLVVVPVVLCVQAETNFGVPFSMLARMAFDIRGANVPSLLLIFVACGWFEIQTWIGRQTIF